VTPPPSPLPLARLRHRHDRLAQTLCLLGGFGVVFAVLLVLGAEPQLASSVGAGLAAAIVAAFWFTVRSARARGNAILISAEQWPELHRIVLDCQARLGLSGLKAYVVQDLVLEQSGLGLGDDGQLLLRSSLVDAALTKGELDVLRFHVGRKCGQVAFGHYGFASTTLAHVGRLVYPLFAWYRRCQEASADRAGLWAAGHRELAHQGLAVLSAGVQIGSRLTPQAVAVQQGQTSHGFWVTLVGWHTERTFFPKRLAALNAAARELAIPD
jgi:hypothetical protein